MMANKKLSKAIADCGWGEALRQFQYNRSSISSYLGMNQESSSFR
jgi:hypothetical protein